jgi:hypothetical protein
MRSLPVTHKRAYSGRNNLSSVVDESGPLTPATDEAGAGPASRGPTACGGGGSSPPGRHPERQYRFEGLAAPVFTEGGTFWRMRVETSVTIDENVLRAIDRATNRTRSRSRVIEDAAREFLARRARTAREARDLEILNAAADALNQDMDDVLACQADA